MTDAVLITAGNKRIGKAIALELSKAGFYLFLHHHDSIEEATETLAECAGAGQIIKCDLGDYAQVEDMLLHIGRSDQQLRHIVNNASLFSVDNALDFDEETFSDHMNINLRGPMQLSRGLYGLLKEGECGSVVNILDSKVFALNADFFSYTIIFS